MSIIKSLIYLFDMRDEAGAKIMTILFMIAGTFVAVMPEKVLQFICGLIGY